MLDTVSGDAIGTETLRYGQRVTVIALPAPPILLTPKGIEHVGPRAFGYDLRFPLGVRVRSQPGAGTRGFARRRFGGGCQLRTDLRAQHLSAGITLEEHGRETILA